MLKKGAIKPPRGWPDPSLVLNLPFSEGYGSIARDRSLYGNHGTIYGASWVDEGLSFDGVDDYVEVPHSTSLDMTDELTLAAWIYSSVDFPASAMVVARPPENSWGIIFNVALRPMFMVRNTDLFSYLLELSFDLSLNTWYHVVGTFKRNDVARLYLNGIEKESTPVSDFALLQSNNNVLIGSEMPDSSYFSGVIDEVRIYKRALSAQEILKVYNAGL